MNKMIKIGFADFKMLANLSQNRIFYFKGDTTTHFYFLTTSGAFIGSSLQTISISETFFHDKVFAGSIRLKNSLETPPDITIVQQGESAKVLIPPETQNRDLQREGVDEVG